MRVSISPPHILAYERGGEIDIKRETCNQQIYLHHQTKR
jgi:hypothetical protein